jgi:hypothetical protein
MAMSAESSQFAIATFESASFLAGDISKNDILVGSAEISFMFYNKRSNIYTLKDFINVLVDQNICNLQVTVHNQNSFHAFIIFWNI